MGILIIEGELISMLRTLQLYTVCIVVLVIVLSQVTIFSDYLSINNKKSFNNNSKSVSQKDEGFFDNLKNTKYGEPLKEIDGIMNQITKSKQEIEKNIGDMSDLLDIEKNINDMYSILGEI